LNDLKKRPLFIYEMANNHMGDVQHGIRIVQELKKASEGFPFSFCVKLQYRDIASCIHPDYQGRFDLKYVKRFTETHLSWEQLAPLVGNPDRLPDVCREITSPIAGTVVS